MVQRYGIDQAREEKVGHCNSEAALRKFILEVIILQEQPDYKQGRVEDRVIEPENDVGFHQKGVRAHSNRLNRLRLHADMTCTAQ